MIDLIKSVNGGWLWEGKWLLVVEQEKDSHESQKGEVNKIWMHVALFKLLDICVVIFIVIFMFQ